MITKIFRPLRRGIVVVSLLALVGLLVAGCAGSQEEGSQESAEEPVTGSFVGEVPDIEGFASLVAAEAKEGEEGREVRAYLCDGDPNGINEWFWGSADGNELQLSSDDGAQLEGNLTPEGATGTITLDDGGSFPFETTLATGIAGLYNVTALPGGQVLGTSESGARVEGQTADEPRQDGLYPIIGTITPPDGQPQDLEAPGASSPSPPETTEMRWIIFDGQVLGARNKQTSGSDDVGFAIRWPEG